jgi:hypothetical protein
MLNVAMHKITTGHYSSDEQFYHCSAVRDLILGKRNKKGMSFEE